MRACRVVTNYLARGSVCRIIWREILWEGNGNEIEGTEVIYWRSSASRAVFHRCRKEKEIYKSILQPKKSYSFSEVLPKQSYYQQNGRPCHQFLWWEDKLRWRIRERSCHRQALFPSSLAKPSHSLKELEKCTESFHTYQRPRKILHQEILNTGPKFSKLALCLKTAKHSSAFLCFREFLVGEGITGSGRLRHAGAADAAVGVVCDVGVASSNETDDSIGSTNRLDYYI